MEPARCPEPRAERTGAEPSVTCPGLEIPSPLPVCLVPWVPAGVTAGFVDLADVPGLAGATRSTCRSLVASGGEAARRPATVSFPRECPGRIR